MKIKNRFILSKQQLTEIQPLVSTGLVNYEEKIFYECRCGNKTCEKIDPKDYFCPVCNKKITPRITQEYNLIVDNLKILNHLKELVEKNHFSVSLENEIITVTGENKKVFIIYEGVAQESVRFSEEYLNNTIYVLCGNIEELVFNTLCPDSLISVEEAISNPQKLIDSINSLLANSGLERPEEDEAKMDYIFENMTPAQFETFITELFEFLQNNKGALIKFISYLDINKGNIFGSKVINLGLAGKEDCRIISLVDYLMPIVKSNNSIEGKRYRVSKTTSIGLIEKREALEHANNAGNTLALIIATTNKIQPNIWDAALTKTGPIDFKVIDLDLMKRIIFGVNAIELVNKYRGYLNA